MLDMPDGRRLILGVGQYGFYGVDTNYLISRRLKKLCLGLILICSINCNLFTWVFSFSATFYSYSTEFIGYSLCHVTNQMFAVDWTLCESMLHQSQGSIFLSQSDKNITDTDNWLLVRAFNRFAPILFHQNLIAFKSQRSKSSEVLTATEAALVARFLPSLWHSSTK